MRFSLNKIYTRKGDNGFTGLVGGGQIAKTALQIEVFGSVDELNAFVGLIRTYALNYTASHPHIATETDQVLKKIQNELFDLGSRLATPAGKSHPTMRNITPQQVTDLENKIDAYVNGLPTLNSFVLPGGNKLNAYAHVARTVCRRLERLLWRFKEEQPLEPAVLQYVNRLSDFLFAYSRWVAAQLGEKEFLWE